MKKLQIAVVAMALGAAQGGVLVAGPAPVDVAAPQVRLDGTSVVGDAPAVKNFERLRALFAAGAAGELQVGVYSLVDPPADPAAHVRSRASELGLKSRTIVFPDGDDLTEKDLESLPDDVSTLGVVEGGWELAFDRFSGTELFVDVKRFHVGPGVDPGKLSPEGFYVASAAKYLEARLGKLVEGAQLYPYKVRRYVDALAEATVDDGSVGEPQITVSQVSVAFNAVVDGFPVIGPGSKVGIHMTPAGDVVGHETTVRALGRRITTLSGDGLVDPGRAQELVEAGLKGRGLDLASYRLARAELGYFRRGRNSVQSVLAPYYAFFYEPNGKEQYARRLVEIAPAVADPKVLALLQEDERLEAARKTRLMRNVGEPDVRESSEAKLSSSR